MSTVTGGELAARTLADFGVSHLFGVHGGHLDSFLVECQRLGMCLVDTRHEAAGGNAAEGYARATGGLAVAFATSGPGFTNAYASLANAKIDRTPMLLITSSPPLREAELNVLQGGLDQVAAANAVTKWAHRATTVARIPDLIALAVRQATTGVPGPVVLDIPIDVMFKKIDSAIAGNPSLTLPMRPAPPPAAIARLVDLLRVAQRPVLLTGGGASMSPGCRPALEALLADVELPVFGVSWGHGLLDPQHSCWAGNSADLAAVQFLAAAPDLVILLGARRGAMTGSRSGSLIPADALVVQVDLDGAEPGRIGAVALAIEADVGETVRALAEVSDQLPGWPAWTSSARSVRNSHALLYSDTPAHTDAGIHPYYAARAVLDIADHDGVVIYDGGETAGWANFFARASQPRSWFGLGNMGGLGVGQGMAIGAQVARPDDQVLMITGDGAVGFHVQEFDTMVRHRLPVITVVMNNSAWAMSLHGQHALYGPDIAVAVNLPETRYDRIAESFGCHGEYVTTIDEVAPAFKRATASGRPACINVRVSAAVVHPMMAGLSAEIPEGSTRIPYYETIPAGEL